MVYVIAVLIAITNTIDDIPIILIKTLYIYKLLYIMLHYTYTIPYYRCYIKLY